MRSNQIISMTEHHEHGERDDDLDRDDGELRPVHAVDEERVAVASSAFISDSILTSVTTASGSMSLAATRSATPGASRLSPMTTVPLRDRGVRARSAARRSCARTAPSPRRRRARRSGRGRRGCARTVGGLDERAQAGRRLHGGAAVVEAARGDEAQRVGVVRRAPRMSAPSRTSASRTAGGAPGCAGGVRRAARPRRQVRAGRRGRATGRRGTRPGRAPRAARTAPDRSRRRRRRRAQGRRR